MATILVVDDVPANRDVLVMLLSKEGHTLLEAADGDEGLLAVRAEHPDLVIADVLMPSMDGYEFVRQLRLDAEIGTTPVVFYTAYYGEREARALALAGGVADVLTKPVESDEVLRVVSRVLSSGVDTGPLLVAAALTPAFDREHLRLVADKLSEKASDLKTSNARLRALINIGLELASERNPNRLLQRVCMAVCDLFGAASVALGVVDPDALTYQHVVTAGASAAAQSIKVGDVLSGILRAVVVERRTVRGDASGDPTNLPFPSHHQNPQTFLATPIASPTQVYGWICLIGSAGRIFTENEEDLVAALSGLVGRIYENGHLVAVAQEHAEALEREITERRHAEDALRASERLNRNLIEHLPHRILVKDRESTVLFCNANYARDVGLSPRDVIGKTTSEFYPIGLSGTHIADDRDVMVSGITKHIEESYEVAGQSRWGHTVKVPYRDERGEVIGILVLSEDITDRRTLEAQLQQAQKMEAVGRLAAGVAHDFNNLLTVILGLCELVLADARVDGDPRRDVLEIQRAGSSAAGLTRQLLAFSRKQIIEPTLIDLNLVVPELKTMVEQLTRNDVKVVMTLRPGRALVRADRGQIEQLVMNLVVNARDAMPQGGTLTIETGHVALDADYVRTHPAVIPGPYIALTISDTGIGITPEVQARLFEPFFTTKEVGRGTGLGLATVQGIVARSGGSLNVYSEIGRGTSFTVYLPSVGETEIVAEVAPGLSPSRACSETVLVVDEGAEIRELAKRLLERQGYRVLTADSGEEASRVFDRHPAIDVLVTDVVMPGANGPELTKRLLGQHPALKVIYMSGYTEDAIAQHGVLNPGIAFVHKPFTSETLGLKIRKVLGA
jgi:PAS domain S-box-containing protein